jgi:hypothetical protein
MGAEALQDILDQLHDELSKVRIIDEDLRDQLQQIMVDIEVLLDESDITGEHHRSSIIKRLNRVVDDFEVSHPRLTKRLGEMAESLSRMGF